MRGLAPAVAALAVWLASAPVLAQLQTIDVHGRVVGPADAPVRAARVVLMDGLGAVVASTASDADGRFSFRQLGRGDYWLRAETDAMQSPLQRLLARDGTVPAPTLRLALRTQETVEVPASAAPSSDERIVLAGATVRRLGGRLHTRALQATIATTPGWSAEDNGLMHFRGVDDGFLYVLDGVPVYERLDPLFGLAPAASTIGSVQILDGYIPPEYGLRSGGVIELRSVSGEERGWGGTLDASVASAATAAASAVVQGTVGGRGSLMLSAAGERSRRFLDPVHPDNLHDQGASGSVEGEYLRAGAGDVQTIRAGFGRSSFQVPNDEEQEAAGQDQRQALRQWFTTVSWQRTWSTRTVSHAAAYARGTSSRLDPSPADTPLSLDAERAQRRIGLLLGVTQLRGAHTVKAGVEVAELSLREHLRFAATDPTGGTDSGLSPTALAYTAEAPFEFSDRARRPQYSVYAQDSWRAGPRLNVDFGVRFDRTRLLLAEHAITPRLGVSYRPGNGSTVLRASLNRFHQPAQTEYLLLASSAQARALSPFADQGGGADVAAERQTALEASVERKLGPARLELAVWQRRIRNQADPNVLFGTNIVFPNSVARGHAKGLDLRLELPRRGPWSAYVSYTLSKVVQFGPINGGLFLEEDFPEIGPGTPFTPDHDQRHVGSAAATYQDDRRGCSATLAARYQSGTPVELPDDALAGLGSRPGSDLVNLETGRVRPHFLLDAIVTARVKRWPAMDLTALGSVLNVAGQRYAFNFGNPFSGTHFGAPRSVTLGLRLARR